MFLILPLIILGPVAPPSHEFRHHYLCTKIEDTGYTSIGLKSYGTHASLQMLFLEGSKQ